MYSLRSLAAAETSGLRGWPGGMAGSRTVGKGELAVGSSEVVAIGAGVANVECLSAVGLQMQPASLAS